MGAHEAVGEHTPLFVSSPVKARPPARQTQRYKGYVAVFAKNRQGDAKADLIKACAKRNPLENRGPPGAVLIHNRPTLNYKTTNYNINTTLY